MNEPTIPELVARKLCPPREGWYDDETLQCRFKFEAGQVFWKLPRYRIDALTSAGTVSDAQYFAPWGAHPDVP